MFQTQTWFQTHVGRVRKNNEDNLVVVEPQEAQQRRESGCLYVVADGVGGHQDGEKASAHAVEKLSSDYFQGPPPNPAERLREIILEINRDLFEQSQASESEGPRMATTVVAAVIRGDKLHLANVGDSRAYLFRNGVVTQISNDHSVVGEMVRAGVITEEEAQKSPKRNRLTRSVGSRETVVVDVHDPIPLQAGDVLLLCSDGLSQYVTPELLAERLGMGTVAQMGQGLLDLALSRGGSDNVTIVVSRVVRQPGPPGWAKSPRFWAWFAAAVLVISLAVVGAGLLLAGARPFASVPVPILAPASETPQPTPIPASTHTDLPPATETTAPQSPTPELAATEESLCYYRVRSGDMLSSIADFFRVPVENIRREGGVEIANPNLINGGETFEIAGASEERCDLRNGQWATPTPPGAQTP